MKITPESPDDVADIEHLLDVAFGPDRGQKTVYRLREGVAPVAELSGVIREDGMLKGSLRFWPVVLGPKRAAALLLGPVAVAPKDRGQGYARALIWRGLERARLFGYHIVLLVGDEPYYGQFGFERRLAEHLTLPGPVDLGRFLGLELVPGALRDVAGMVQRAGPGEARPLTGGDGPFSASAA
jgi:predicted N-acetyltransferase YhbS